MKRYTLFLLFWALSAVFVSAQSPSATRQLNILPEFYNFGEIDNSIDELEGHFYIRNSGQTPVRISNIVAVCHCTDVDWTEQTLAPGDSCRISFVYHKEAYAKSFNKTINIYSDQSSDAFVFCFSGSFYDSDVSLKLHYPYSRGALGLPYDPVTLPKLYKGEQMTETVEVANLSGAAIDLTARSQDRDLVADFLTTSLEAYSTGILRLSINPDKERWGWQNYRLIPVIDGREAEAVTVQLFVSPDFRKASIDEQRNGPYPSIESRNIRLGSAKAGTVLTAEIRLRNLSEEPMSIYDVNSREREFSSEYKNVIGANEAAVIKISLNTSGKEAGDYYTTLSLVSNSPALPVAEITVTYTIL